MAQIVKLVVTKVVAATCSAPGGCVALAALFQELEELDAFAQAALHHVGLGDHLADDRGDLAASGNRTCGRRSRRS